MTLDEVAASEAKLDAEPLPIAISRCRCRSMACATHLVSAAQPWEEPRGVAESLNYARGSVR